MSNYHLAKLSKVPSALKDSILRSKAEYCSLGRSGLKVSNPILGGMHIGDSRWLPWVLNEDEGLPLLKAAYDRGINTWDTANVYSNGESERIIGKALQVYGIPRRKVVLMTKCYRVVCDAENHDPGSGVTMHQTLAQQSKDYVNQCASLERLGTTYIDLLQIHRYDYSVPPEETMQTLHSLVQSGKVRYIGASSMWAYQFASLQNVAEKHGWTKFISMQNHYNLLYREEEREMIAYCNATGVAGRLVRRRDQEYQSIRCATPMNGAVYAIEGSDCGTIVSRVRDIAESRNWPMSHVSLAWLNGRVTAPIIGFSSIQRMDEVLSARGLRLSSDEEDYLESPYLPKKVIGHV
nr:aldo-keto reductase dtxs3 [Quercus suber]